MKKYYFLLIALGFFTGINAQVINFPDAKFKERLVTSSVNTGTVTDFSGNYFKLDANSDGEIQVSEALLVKEMRVTGQNGSNVYTNMAGIEYFTNMLSLKCAGGNPITSLNISNLTQLKVLEFVGTQITSLDLSTLVNLEELNYAGNPQLTNLIIYASNVINKVNCNGNNLTSIDLSIYPNLKSLDCSYNQVTNIDLSAFPNFESLYCSNNNLSFLNLNGLSNLQFLECNDNPLLPLINFSDFPNLRRIYCHNNPLQTSLNLSGLTKLFELICVNLQLTSLDLNDCTELFFLNCDNNQITTLDINDLTKLQILSCRNNLLNTLFIKGIKFNILGISDVHFEGNPNLYYICSNDDNNMLNYYQYLINNYGYTNCFVNSYCSFTPGGTYYTIEGNIKYDENNNGCDVSDINYPNLKFDITNGTTSGSLISNISGNYSIPVETGTHSITPVLENPNYYFISPTTLDVTFPTQASPFIQDFCVTPNGVHSDLEIVMYPLRSAKAGADVKYEIIYKNKGNQTQSGFINLDFNDSVLDLVTSNPSVSNQTVNNLSWDYSNLSPFETREISFTLKLNAPTDTPPINSGDVLNYTATIISPATDETPNDNTFVLNQIVSNSYDPNDKTCLEGTTIAPEKVGDYVHYMIRFENNGTANAQNIVVKDIIDTNKYDINSLILIKGSAEFVTKISNTNKVEFIFENINLPFDDANNDGFVAFKIKTLPTLVNGDTFSNDASIYFDYNFPIVTAPATTTVQALSKQDFVFGKYFSLYPNPVAAVLNITAKESIALTSINIYNTLGQLVLVIPSAQNVSNVDVSSLKTGNYFIKINSDKGTANTKFIKN